MSNIRFNLKKKLTTLNSSVANYYLLDLIIYYYTIGTYRYKVHLNPSYEAEPTIIQIDVQLYIIYNANLFWYE